MSAHLDVDTLCRGVSTTLWNLYHALPDSTHLIWPMDRFGVVRVCEQESKIVITQRLEEIRLHYSVETPTRLKYRQTSDKDDTAHHDVTVYGDQDGKLRVLNCELKQGDPAYKEFRKDFEKLLRENIPGLWFHTLRYDRRWESLRKKISDSFKEILERHEQECPSLHLAFCVLVNRPGFYRGCGSLVSTVRV